MTNKSVLVPGNMFHYARCMSCGNIITPTPKTCFCGGAIVPPNVPAPETTAEDWMICI